MTAQGTQVTLTIPEGAQPGALLSVPVRGGAEQLKVRVPDGLGPGSTLILTQPEGSDEWNMQVGTALPAEPAAPEPWAEPWAEPPGPAPEPALEGAAAYTVRLETTAGPIDVIARPDWAPHGTRRFLELAASGDLVELAFYRAIKGCIVQFGLPARRPWAPIPDDPPTGVPFLLGAVSFAAIGENTRRSTLFICIGDMSHMLGQKSWETPIGAVAESSLEVLEQIDTSYGDIAEFGGAGPDTNRINNEGGAYLAAHFPRLTYIRSAYPLDWHPDDVLLGAGAPESAAGGQSPDRQIALALQAAQEAQLQAEEATRAAAEAALAEYAAQAAEAARIAQHAAQAAQTAARAALVAQREEESLWGGAAQDAPPQAARRGCGSPLAPAGRAEPIDVPVELRMTQRRSVGCRGSQAQRLADAPRSTSFGQASYQPAMSAPIVVAPGAGQSVVMSALRGSTNLQPVQRIPLGTSVSFRSQTGTALIPGARQMLPSVQPALQGHSPLVVNR